LGIAGIIDKILISEGKPQRFGTQFRFSDGRGEMLPVEEAAKLDQRRARYFLQPISEYKKTLADFYKVKIE
jgi:hypothetical protein